MIVKRSLKEFDPELSAAIDAESKRQENHIELIASENYTSHMVMEAQGGKLTNKYAEGYPGKRYYGGCEHVDVVENLAISRAKQLFAAAYANVQPHSGSQANAAVYSALLNAGDTILGMSLDHGGHLTHGSTVNFSGKIYNSIQYGIDECGNIDYEEVERLAKEHNPKMIVAGFSAFSGLVDWARMREIADKVNAWLFVDMAHVAGLVATGNYPSPIQYAHVVTSTTHKTLGGPRGGLILSGIDDISFTKKFDSAVFPCNQGGPLMHVIAAKAVAFKEAMEPEFAEYQHSVIMNAKVMAYEFTMRGYNIVSGGTDNHMFLVDLSDKGITGKEADAALGNVNITVNKNTVPNDKQSPFVTSGLRIGVPAITRRGIRRCTSRLIANLICDVLDDITNETVMNETRDSVAEICANFPVYESVE